MVRISLDALEVRIKGVEKRVSKLEDSNADMTDVKISIQKLTDGTPITDSAFGSGTSYAGYNNSNERYGESWWLRSPTTLGSDSSYRVYYDGGISSSRVCYPAYGVAPAFCI